MHKNVTGSLVSQAIFLSEKNTKIALEVKGQGQIAPKFNHFQLCR